MIETKERIIGGSKYQVTQMTARRALRMQAKLLKLFGASLAHILLPSAGEEENIKGATFSKSEAINALKDLACEIDESTFEKLVVELLSGVRKEGIELNEGVIDLEFAGELNTLFQVIWFVLEVNFSFFFGEGGIGSLAKESTPPKKKVSKTKYTKN